MKAERHLGTNLKRHRTIKGWTQGKTAKKAGITRVAYGRIERDESMPSMKTFRKLVKLFGICPSHLLSKPEALARIRWECSIIPKQESKEGE